MLQRLGRARGLLFFCGGLGYVCMGRQSGAGCGYIVQIFHAQLHSVAADTAFLVEAVEQGVLYPAEFGKINAGVFALYAHDNLSLRTCSHVYDKFMQ